MNHRLICGDVIEVLRTLPDQSVHMCVTSPPYWGLRDYGVDGQIGLESTPDEFVDKLVAVFREVKRVLRDDSTLWLNLGDVYAANRSYQVRDNKHVDVGNTTGTTVPVGLKAKDLVGIPWRVAFALQVDGWILRSDIIWSKNNPMPESVRDRPTRSHEYVFLLTKQPRYYYDADAVREPNSSPAQLAHNLRYAKTYEGYDARAGATGQPGNVNNVGIHSRPGKQSGHGRRHAGFNGLVPPAVESGTVIPGRNRRSVWTISTQPFPEAHFSTFPEKLVEPCILAGSSDRCCASCGAPWKRLVETNNPSKWSADDDIRSFNNDGRTSNPQSSKSLHRQKGGVYSTAVTTGWEPTCPCDAGVAPGVVLDCFAGSGTVGAVCERLGRDSILIDLKQEYLDMAEGRIEKARNPPREKRKVGPRTTQPVIPDEPLSCLPLFATPED